MTRVYYRDAQGCIVMFDLSKRSTFLSAMKWKKDVDAKCQLSDGAYLPAILLGNKVRIDSLYFFIKSPPILLHGNFFKNLFDFSVILKTVNNIDPNVKFTAEVQNKITASFF